MKVPAPGCAAMHPRLHAAVRHAASASPFYARKFAGRNLDDFGRLPFTTKQELAADQVAQPPYGTVLTKPPAAYSRLHQSSGTSTGRPLVWLDTAENWAWMAVSWGASFEVMGVRADDRLFFPFSFGPFLGFWAPFERACRDGRFCVAGGGMSSAARLRVIATHGITGVFCTPTYALRLAEVAAAEGVDLANSSVRFLVVAGEPGGSIPETRGRIEAAWGARVFDHHGLTEVGPVAVECRENPGGMHVLPEFVAEVVEPSGAEPVAPGTVGELILTNLGRLDSPLVRYRTGDLVRLDARPCPCGRDWPRLAGGVLGRADDMILVRGNNVYPAALEGVVRRLVGVAEYRVEVDHSGPLAEVAVTVEGDADLAARLARALKDELMFRAEVRPVPAGTLERFEMKARRISHGPTRIHTDQKGPKGEP